MNTESEMLSVVAFRILHSQPLVDVHCSPTAMVVYKRIASLIAGKKKRTTLLSYLVLTSLQSELIFTAFKVQAFLKN